MMVGRLLSFWEAIFSGAMFDFREGNLYFRLLYPSQFVSILGSTNLDPQNLQWCLNQGKNLKHVCWIDIFVYGKIHCPEIDMVMNYHVRIEQYNFTFNKSQVCKIPLELLPQLKCLTICCSFQMRHADMMAFSSKNGEEGPTRTNHLLKQIHDPWLQHHLQTQEYLKNHHFPILSHILSLIFRASQPIPIGSM